jgi:two-component system, OmpR family, manganese sensing response regulator
VSKILIAEDDKNLAEVLRDALSMQGHTVEVTHDGLLAWDFLRLYAFDALILDWDLPSLPGIAICANFRAQGGTSPVLMLTAKSKLIEKTTGFDSGVDDYLTKPFELQELLVRMRALLRRPSVLNVGGRLVVGDIVVDTDNRRVLKAGLEIKLKPKEFALLEYLLRNRGTIFSAEQLLRAIWTADEPVGSETVRTHIKHIRAKLDAADSPSLIVNVFAVGYKIEDGD